MDSKETATKGWSQPQERSGLNKIIWFGIFQLVSLVAGSAVGFYVFATVFATSAARNLPPNSTPAQVSTALGALFHGIALIVPVVIALELVGWAVLTLGLRDFGKVDRSEFSVPSTLMLLEIAGGAVAAVGVFLVLNSIPSMIAQAPTTGSTPTTPFFATIGSFFAAFIVVVIGALLEVIGLVGGQILGLWRVGSRYDEMVIKLGAIFVIVPVLGIVAPILVLVGAYQARGRLSQPH